MYLNIHLYYASNNLHLNVARRPSVTLGVASAHGLASVANNVIMIIAGLVAAGTGWRYHHWRQARTGCERHRREPLRLEQRCSASKDLWRIT